MSRSAGPREAMSVTSPTTTSTGVSPSPPPAGSRRTRARTCSPRSTSALASQVPTNPLAPVINARIIRSRRREVPKPAGVVAQPERAILIYLLTKCFSKRAASFSQRRFRRKIARETVFPSAALVGAEPALRTKPIPNVPTRGGDRMAAKKSPKKSAKKSGAKRKPNAAFMKPMTPSPILAEVVGDKPIPRTEVVKKLWQYIKRNNLQDPKERRMINADDKLRAVFGGKRQVSMFEMTKLVNKQLS